MANEDEVELKTLSQVMTAIYNWKGDPLLRKEIDSALINIHKISDKFRDEQLNDLQNAMDHWDSCVPHHAKENQNAAEAANHAKAKAQEQAEQLIGIDFSAGNIISKPDSTVPDIFETVAKSRVNVENESLHNELHLDELANTPRRKTDSTKKSITTQSKQKKESHASLAKDTIKREAIKKNVDQGLKSQEEKKDKPTKRKGKPD